MFKEDGSVTESQNKSATKLLFVGFIIVTCLRSALSKTSCQLHRLHDFKECLDLDMQENYR